MSKLFPHGFFKVVWSICIVTFIITFILVIIGGIEVTKQARKNKINYLNFQIQQIKDQSNSTPVQLEELKKLEGEKQKTTFLKILLEDIFDDLKDNGGFWLLFLILLGPSILVLTFLIGFSLIFLVPLRKLIKNDLKMFQWLYAVLLLVSTGLIISLFVFSKNYKLQNFLSNPGYSFLPLGEAYVTITGSFIADIELASVVNNAKIICEKNKQICMEASTTILKSGFIDSDLIKYRILNWNSDFVMAYNLDPVCTWYLLKIDFTKKIVAKFRYKKPGLDNEKGIFKCGEIEKRPIRMLMVDGFYAWPDYRKLLSSKKEEFNVIDPLELELPDISYSEVINYDANFQNNF